ncbi:MAG: anti-sigma factor [Actinomycetota bacterium]|nr:anti-sigma factor [Actinomycetota bacterium]
MPEHRRAEELLGPYVLGELGPGEEGELERHLEGCPACREEVAIFRLAHRAMATASIPPPPELKARVVGDPPRRSRHPAWSRWPAAALLAVLFTGALYAGIFAPSGTTATPLSPTGLAPEASGEVNLEGSGADNARVRLEVSGLPELRPDEYYELWFVRGDGQRISGGGFTVDREGRATVSLNAPRAARGYPGVGITLEESPGDPRPSPDKVLGGELREA